MDAANCAAVLLSVPISYHFHGCSALLVALVVVSGAILNTHLYLLPLQTVKPVHFLCFTKSVAVIFGLYLCLNSPFQNLYNIFTNRSHTLFYTITTYSQPLFTSTQYSSSSVLTSIKPFSSLHTQAAIIVH